MDVVTLLATDQIAFEAEVSSKKRAIERLAELLSLRGGDVGFRYEATFDALIAREKLGSTALGNGIAVPHACMEVPYPKAALLVVEEGLKLDAPDKKPIGVFLALIVPIGQERSHALLAKLTSVLNHKSFYPTLVQLKDPTLILSHIQSLLNQEMAA